MVLFWWSWCVQTMGWRATHTETTRSQLFNETFCKVHKDIDCTLEEVDVKHISFFPCGDTILARSACTTCSTTSISSYSASTSTAWVVFIDIDVKLDEILLKELLNHLIFDISISDQMFIISQTILIDPTSALHLQIFGYQLPFL